MHYMISEDGLSFEEFFPPEPGERCLCCNRRVNKPRTDESPPSKQIRITLPIDRAEWAEEALDSLQQVVGADSYSHPRGRILEALLVLGGQERESLRAYFNGDGGAL